MEDPFSGKFLKFKKCPESIILVLLVKGFCEIFHVNKKKLTSYDFSFLTYLLTNLHSYSPFLNRNFGSREPYNKHLSKHENFILKIVAIALFHFLGDKKSKKGEPLQVIPN